MRSATSMVLKPRDLVSVLRGIWQNTHLDAGAKSNC